MSRSDERSFLLRLVVMTSITVTGGFLAVQATPLAPGGSVLLAAMFVHAVELQHQCRHHSTFRNPRWHRRVGVALGVPMLISYTHFRVQHLHHHRYLGTPDDREFFTFDKAEALTPGRFVLAMFDLSRFRRVGRDVVRAFRGTWSYELGHLPRAIHRRCINEYRALGLLVAVAVVLLVLGNGRYVVALWLLPLLIAVPLHFLIELPEHYRCDLRTTDVLENTRSITGGRFLHLVHEQQQSAHRASRSNDGATAGLA